MLKKNKFLLTILVFFCLNAHAQFGKINYQTQTSTDQSDNYSITIDSIVDGDVYVYSNDTRRNYTFSLMESDSDIYSNIFQQLDQDAESFLDSINQNYYNKINLLNNELQRAGSIIIFRELEQKQYSIENEHKRDLAFYKIRKNKAKEYEYRSRTQNDFNFFKVKNVIDAQLFYNDEANEKKISFLKNSLFSFNTANNNVSLFNELYSDFFGPFRFGFGALIANAQNTTMTDDEGNIISIDSSAMKQDATQRLLGGGGNAVFSLGYPIMSYTKDNNFFIKAYFLPKFAIDIPELGSSTLESAYNYDIGIEGSAYFVGILNTITFFSEFRFGFVNGDQQFFANLLKEDQKAFNFNQLSIGISINSTFRLSWNTFFGSNFVRDNFNSTISFSIIPN